MVWLSEILECRRRVRRGVERVGRKGGMGDMVDDRL